MTKIVKSNDIKQELIKLIKSANIEEIIYEPRYLDGYNKKFWIGSIITIRTLNKGVKRGKN
jgi:hypothetical protein